MTSLSTEPSSPDPTLLRRLRAPLQLLFWGMLPLAITPRLALRVGDQILTTDPFVVVIGLALTTAGAIHLGFGDFFYGAADLIASSVAVLYACMLILAVAGWFVPRLQDPGPLAQLAFGFFRAAGLVALAGCLAQLSTRAGLLTLARHWLITAALGAICWPLPQAILTISPGLASHPAFLGLAPLVSLIPVAAWLITLQQMRAQTRPQ